MRLLIAYDGSRDSEAAIDDLHRCGLPATGSAEVISIAEVWLPPPGSIDGTDQPQSESVEGIVREWREKGDRAVSEADMLARFAVGRVRGALLDWEITSLASYGSAGWEIVNEADRMDADLILVGAQGQSFLSRLALGSISQRVLTEARCSVRIGRGKIDLDSGPERIVVGFDGSRGANAAVAAVADRAWNRGTEVRLISVNEPLLPTTIGRFVKPMVRTVDHIIIAERVWLEESAEAALAKLRNRGIPSSLRTCSGNPKHILIDEAENWGADCIFVGANAWGSPLERFLIGSTSAAVAARAHCSVEVVRAKVTTTQQIDHPRQNGMRTSKSRRIKR